MLLFDDGERSYTGYRVPQESSFAFLNRSGQPKFERTRILLENWFHKYPAAHQVALGTAFRSNEDTQHWGAFFELYCHALLRHVGFTSSVQMVADAAVNRPIDFLVQQNDTPLFYLEATVAEGAKAVLTNQRKIWELIDALDTLDEPNFQVSIEVEQESPHNLPLSQIRSVVHQWLETLDPDQVAEQRRTTIYHKHPQCSWERDGWKILFFAIPLPREERGSTEHTVLYHGWGVQKSDASPGSVGKPRARRCALRGAGDVPAGERDN